MTGIVTVQDLIGELLEPLQRHIDRQFVKISGKLDEILKEVKAMALDQATFDAELSALVTSIGDLTTAVDAWMASHPDLTAEGQQVQDAAAAVQAELDKLAPPA